MTPETSSVRARKAPGRQADACTAVARVRSPAAPAMPGKPQLIRFVRYRLLPVRRFVAQNTWWTGRAESAPIVAGPAKSVFSSAPTTASLRRPKRLSATASSTTAIGQIAKSHHADAVAAVIATNANGNMSSEPSSIPKPITPDGIRIATAPMSRTIATKSPNDVHTTVVVAQPLDALIVATSAAMSPAFAATT